MKRTREPKQSEEPRQELNPKTNRLETELGNGWMVIEQLERQRGRRVVSLLIICPAPGPLTDGVRLPRAVGEVPLDGKTPDGGITARLLRTIKVGRHHEPIADYRE